MTTDLPPPPAITRFERLWWGSTLAWLGGAVLAWERTRHMLEATPEAAPVASLTQPVMIALMVLVTAGLWFGVVRRASAVAKWLVVLIAGLGALRALNIAFTLATTRYPHPLSSGLFLLATALGVASAWALFGAEARAWFGEEDA